MLIFLSLCYAGMIWLIYFKLELLPYNQKNKILSTTIGIVLLSAIFLIMIMVTPYSQNLMIEGKINHLAPRVSGLVQTINIQAGQIVPKGTPLFHLSSTTIGLQVSEAEGNLRAAEAAYQKAKKQRGIAVALETADPESISQLQIIESEETLNALKGSLKSAKSSLDQAKNDLSKTTVYAPSEGFAPFITFANETPVNAYTPIMTFISVEDLNPMATFNQNAVSMVEPGNKVEFMLDIYPGHVFTGVVDEVVWAAGEAQIHQSRVLPNVDQIIAPRQYIVRIKVDEMGEEFPLRYAARGQGVIYTNYWRPLHIIQKIHIRMTAWLKYLAIP